MSPLQHSPLRGTAMSGADLLGLRPLWVVRSVTRRPEHWGHLNFMLPSAHRWTRAQRYRARSSSRLGAGTSW